MSHFNNPSLHALSQNATMKANNYFLGGKNHAYCNNGYDSRKKY